MMFVSLFTGIGGIDLGLERAGHECVGQVEIDAYCQRVLAKHWPDTPRIADVRDIQGDEFGPFDLLTAGYPCQPFSNAGRRGGDTDERHLWPEVHRIVCRVRPRMLLLENVPGHLALGFDRVLGDLAESGYDAEWQIIPAASIGAPHARERVFVLADAREQRLQGSDHSRSSQGLGGSRHEPARSGPAGSDRRSTMAATARRDDRLRRSGQPTRHLPPLPRAAPRTMEWPAEPRLGRVADGIPHRVDRLRTLGNAVVPQVAEWIGRRLP